MRVAVSATVSVVTWEKYRNWRDVAVQRRQQPPPGEPGNHDARTGRSVRHPGGRSRTGSAIAGVARIRSRASHRAPATDRR